MTRAKPRPWTPEDIATAARVFASMQGHYVTKRLQAIAAALNRTPGSVDGRHNQFGDLFEYRSDINRMEGRGLIVPGQVLHERDARLSRGPRDLTALLMGDPLPGQSALERRV